MRKKNNNNNNKVTIKQEEPSAPPLIEFLSSHSRHAPPPPPPIAIAFAPQLINWWQPDEFAAERAQRVKLVYSIIDRSIDAFRLIPQVSEDRWPAPRQLREIAGNTKDAIAFLSIGTESKELDKQRKSFNKDGVDFVVSTYTLADKCADYASKQHRDSGSIKSTILFLNDAFCRGDYEQVIILLKELFTMTREATDQSKGVLSLLKILLDKGDRLWQTARSLSVMANKNLKEKKRENELTESSSYLYWFQYNKYKERLMEITGESEYLGHIIQIASATVEGIKVFEQTLFGNKDNLENHLAEQEKLIAELEKHLKTKIPTAPPSSAECKKYRLMSTVFLNDIERWDNMRLRFLDIENNV